MHRFHGKLRDYPDIKTELETAFAQIKESFGRIPEFRTFNTNLREHFAELVGSMTHRLEVDFEAYNPSNFFQALRLEASEGGSPRALAEMGTGEQQVLAMAFAHAFARAFHGGIILIIEEPESHLHPLAQQWLAAELSDMCHGGLQVIITTHSPAFVDILNIDGIALVTKHNSATRIIQRTVGQLVTHCLASGAPAARTTVDNILPFYKANATPAILEGVFAKAVVLVEGPSESLSLPIYLAKVGFEAPREGVSIIGVQGKGNLAKWRRLFTLYGIPCYVMFDNDTADDGNGSKRRDALLAIGIPEGDQPQYVETEDWLIEDEFAVFGVDFETALRAEFPSYAALEAQAIAEGVESKPFRARFVAEHLEIDGAPGWQRMFDIAARVRTLLRTANAADIPAAPPEAPEDPDMPF
jgi:putative ATP-dependent endonuclease of OLD family